MLNEWEDGGIGSILLCDAIQLDTMLLLFGSSTHWVIEAISKLILKLFYGWIVIF